MLRRLPSVSQAKMQKTRRSEIRILFIGNSFTARNDLPELISRLSASQGQVVECRLLSIGGASLRTHWNKGEAQSLIRTGRFDSMSAELRTGPRSLIRIAVGPDRFLTLDRLGTVTVSDLVNGKYSSTGSRYTPSPSETLPVR
jgi:hypothetical protein